MRRNLLLARARKAPCFCGLALSKQLLFCSLLKLFVQTKGNCHGEKSTVFPALAPLCASSHSMLSDCVHFHSSVSSFQLTARQGLLPCNVKASLKPSDPAQHQSQRPISQDGPFPVQNPQGFPKSVNHELRNIPLETESLGNQRRCSLKLPFLQKVLWLVLLPGKGLLFNWESSFRKDRGYQFACLQNMVKYAKQCN